MAFFFKKFTTLATFIFLLFGIAILMVFFILQLVLRRQNKEVTNTLTCQFSRSINQNMDARWETDRKFVQDYTAWDELIENINKKDTAWIHENVGEITDAYQFQDLFVYSSSAVLIYHSSLSNSLESGAFPINNDSIPFLFKNRTFVHFFKQENSVLFEYTGATIVPAKNIVDRASEPQGFFFIVKEWDSAFVNALEESAQAEIIINEIPDVGEENLHVQKKLPGFSEENPIALHFVRNQEIIFNRLEKSRNTFFMLWGAQFIILVFIGILADRYIISSLTKLSESLENDDQNTLKNIYTSTEDMARLVKGVSENIELRRKLSLELLEREKREKELKELNHTKDRLFSVIGHDLINPFNTISGFSELLENTNASDYPNKVKDYARTIRSTSKEAHHILETLLTWGRMQTGMIAIKPEEINIQDQINDAVILAKNQASLKKINVTVDCSEQVKVFADRNMIQIVLRNLLSNAIKFTKQNGLVVIKVTTDTQDARIEVRDNGVGMLPEKAKELFMPEKSSSARGTANEKGTGLGLILCMQVVTANKGKIWVNSILNEGTSIFFTLPLA